MAANVYDLLAEILSLPSWDRQRLLELLEAARKAEPLGVRDSDATYQSTSMRFVTIALPDDIAEQAQNAGLLSSRILGDILRRTLQAQGANNDTTAQHQQRRLLEKNGYLVAEALPGERRITTEEVHNILHDMEW